MGRCDTERSEKRFLAHIFGTKKLISSDNGSGNLLETCTMACLQERWCVCVGRGGKGERERE